MKKGFLTSLCPMHIWQLTEAESVSTISRGIHIPIDDNTRANRGNFKNLADLLIEFVIRYRSPVFRC